MAATPATLRALFPEFSDLSKYPDTSVALWLGVAANFINAEKWGPQADLGTMLYAAHKLALMASSGGLTPARPGQIKGVLTSKSADGISASYDVSSVMNEGAGHWNLTTYGLQYWELKTLFGHGPVQVGVTVGGDSLMPWSGVIYPTP
jgi:hypothetical protein